MGKVKFGNVCIENSRVTVSIPYGKGKVFNESTANHRRISINSLWER